MNYICESCGSDLKYYDKVSRMVRTKNRKASIITIKRFKCPVCNCIHRNLPNNIFPYKQYDARIITGVIEGKITSDMIDYEDYPCEMTMTKFVKEVTRMSYIKRLFVDRIIDLYDNGEKPEHIAKILSISEEDVRVITDEFE